MRKPKKTFFYGHLKSNSDVRVIYNSKTSELFAGGLLYGTFGWVSVKKIVNFD